MGQTDRWQLREFDYSSSYNPDIRFSKPDPSVLRIDSYTAGSSSLGRGYVFLNIARSFLNGKKLRIRWNVYYSYPDSRDLKLGILYVFDAQFDRADMTSYFQPEQDREPIFDYTNVEATYYPGPLGSSGWLGWRVDTSGVLDLSAWTSDYVTILIRMHDSWTGQTVMVDVDYVQILDASDNVVREYHFDQDIVMEVTGTLNDYGYMLIAMAYEKTLTETLGLADTVVKAPSAVRAEALGLVDAYSRTWTVYRAYTESLGLSDIIVKSPSILKVESLGLTDYILKFPSAVKSETLALVDVYSRAWSAYRTYSESLGLTDYVLKTSSTVRSETIGLKDYVEKKPSILRAEVLGLQDFIAKLSSVIKTEALGLTDVYARSWSAYRTYAESLALTDYILKKPSVPLIELLGLSDFIAKLSSVVKAETLALTDFTLKKPALVKYETLSLADFLTKQPSKILPETLGLKDVFSRTWAAQRTFAEALGLKDYISKFLSLSLTESLGLKDWKALTPNPLQIYKLADKLRKLIDIKGA